MYKKFHVLAVIPARGGSKGVPHKNIRLLNGKPLINYSIEAAKKSKFIDRIIVSTDDKTIANMARRAGAEIPFLRPKSLSQDRTPDYPVFKHCLDTLRGTEDYRPDIVVHLRPTGPLRSAKEIDAAIALLASNKNIDSVRSVHQTETSPYKMWRLKKGRMIPLLKLANRKEAYNAPRQSLPTVYQTNPHVGVVWTKTIMKKKSILGDVICPFVISAPVIDIDTLDDFKRAEQILRKRS